MNIQTDPILEAVKPMMKSQSISVQEDLKIFEKVVPKKPSGSSRKLLEKHHEESKSSTVTVPVPDLLDTQMDMGSAAFQEKLIAKIMDQANIIDIQDFMSNLM